MPTPALEPKLPRTLHLALFAIGLLWVLAARIGAQSAADGISRALHAEVFQHVLQAVFLVILLVTGFTALNWVAVRNGSIRATNALPVRATATQEWQMGAALGWALALLAILPMAGTGAMHAQFWIAPRAWGLSFLSLLTLIFGSLATELAFRGFLFRSLLAATGPTLATVLLSGIYALTTTSSPLTTPFSFVVAFVLGLLFSMAYLRTHALWLGWGLHFGWLACIGVLFGLPLGGSAELAGVIATETSGPGWLSGSAYGPEGALLTALVVIAGIIALYRLTRDYAWQYTHTRIVAGGYPMDVPPPAAHAAMEAAAQPPSLVQILGATPTAASTAPFINDHLEANGRVESHDFGRETLSAPENPEARP